MDSLKAEGIEFLTETEVIKLAQQDGLIVTTVRDAQGGSSRISAESVLIAVGRRPNLEGIELEKAGVEFDRREIKVDRFLRTSARNIYAAGDVVPPYLFTHIAEYEAITGGFNFPHKSVTLRPCQDGVSFGGVVGVVDLLVVVGFGCTSSSRYALSIQTR
jgi:pyruvate/2-oxoglutarate dehydrogenase complex dihydrolipoamide dehydrogenase (E3) component